MEPERNKYQKIFIILNPVSGILPVEAVREKIEAALGGGDIDYKVYETSGQENLKKVTLEAVRADYDLVVAAGGDGTISGVANGLVDSGIPLGVIPKGTGNVLARSLDIPLQIEGSLRLLVEPSRIWSIDVMQVGDDFYTLGISAGIGSVTMSETRREEKRRLGMIAYILAGMRQLWPVPSHKFEVEVDGVAFKFRASSIYVANCGSIGFKTTRLDPRIQLDDGKLNVCRIYASRLIDYFQLLLYFISPVRRRDWKVFCVEAGSEVKIKGGQDLPVQGDGDVIGSLPVEIKLRPGALKVVVPTSAEPAQKPRLAGNNTS